MKSKYEFAIIKQVWKGGFVVFDKCIVEYDDKSEDFIDSRIKRIESGEYVGSIIWDDEIMVMKYDDSTNSTVDLESLIKISFGLSDNTIMYCQHPMEVSTDYIRKIFKKAEDCWSKKDGHLEDYKIIYQGPNIPIRIPDMSEVEIYEKDFSIFGIERYENWIPYIDEMETDTTYHLHGVFIVDDVYISATHYKTFQLVNGKEDIPHKFILPESGFVDNKTFNTIGFYSDVELDIFYQIKCVDTDSVMVDVILVTAELEKYMNNKKGL